MRRLRRVEDSFVYEPVIVGSFEDALCAAIVNPKILAVIVAEGVPFRSKHEAPVLRRILDDTIGQLPSDASALKLAGILKGVRPDLDIYVTTDREVERLASDPAAASARRIFYAVEEFLELHLAVLEGIQARFETPFFDNLKRYAQRPIGTFHALPIARGKSVFSSPWIRDMGEFYGINLFLAESSATTGGLDSLLEPTGNIKKAQEHGGARLWRGPRLLRDQRDFDQQQDGRSGSGGAGRHRDRRSQLPQVASLWIGARRRPAALCRGFPAYSIFDVWRGAAGGDQEGAARPAR